MTTEALTSLFPRAHFRFGGGGGGQQAAQIQAAPIPTPAAPVTTSNAEVIQAEQDMAQQNLLKKSVKKTIFAGDTGSYQPGALPGAAPAPTSYKR